MDDRTVTMAQRVLGWARDRRVEMQVAALFLTRLPVPCPNDIDPALQRRAMAMFPVIGALVGGFGALVYGIGIALGLPPVMAAVPAVGTQLMLTGVLHEDGLADTADGLGGGRSRARKLEIMRDSRLGSFGAAALILILIARWQAIATLADPTVVFAGLVLAGACSRAGAVVLAGALKAARTDGLSVGYAPPRMMVRAAVVLAVVLATAVAGPAGLIAGFAGAMLATAIVGYVAERQLGGQTGDILGATQQIGEILCLFIFVAVIL